MSDFSKENASFTRSRRVVPVTSTVTITIENKEVTTGVDLGNIPTYLDCAIMRNFLKAKDN